MVVLAVGELLSPIGAPIRNVLGLGDGSAIAIDNDDIVGIYTIKEIGERGAALQEQWHLVLLELHDLVLSVLRQWPHRLLRANQACCRNNQQTGPKNFSHAISPFNS